MLSVLSSMHLQLIPQLPPNHALQRTRPSHPGCHPRLPQAVPVRKHSLSLGR
jgi:hypothetical protein